jgi:predicted SnoaL-like aldol condensation-catalyzing enzyme
VAPDDQDQIRAVALRWVEALNTGELRVLDEIVAEDVLDHSGFSRVHGRGRDGIKRLVTELRRVMPDWSSKVDEIVVRGDRVTIRHTGSGTPPPPFLGRGRAGGRASSWTPRKVHLQLVSTIRIDRGRIVEHWAKANP